MKPTQPPSVPVPPPFTDEEWLALCVAICYVEKEIETNPDNRVAAATGITGMTALIRVAGEEYLDDLMTNRVRPDATL